MNKQPQHGNHAEPELWVDLRWLSWFRLGRGRPAGILLLVVLAALLFAGESRPELALRYGLFDTYQRLSPRERVNDSVVVVEIDDRSLAELGQWPWPRTRLAELVERLASEHPAVIAVDAIFAEPDRLSPPVLAQQLGKAGYAQAARTLAHLPDNDQRLASALHTAPVVLGVGALQIDPGFGSGTGYRTPIREFGGEAAAFAPRYAAALRSIEVLDRAAAGHGVLNSADEGGIVRRVPSVVAIGDMLMPGIAVEILRMVSGTPVLNVRVDRDGIASVDLGDIEIPTGPNGEWWLHFSDPLQRPHVSAVDVLRGESPAEMLAGRIALLGYTALGLQDNVTTPLGRMPGVEVHAEAIDNALDGRLLSRPLWTPWLEAGLLIALGLASVLTVPWLRPALSAGVYFASIPVVAAAGILAFMQAGWLIDVANPLAGAGLVFGFMLVATLGEAESQRRSLRRALMVSQIVQARLEGELDAARRIQIGMLPVAREVLGADPRVDIAALMRPARTVGGDLYDFFLLDRSHLFFMVGDVSGKGLPASLFMALAKAQTHSGALRSGADPGHALTEAAAALTRENPEQLFVSALAGVLDLDSGKLTWCSAGHEAPCVLHRDGATVQLTGRGGPPLCVIDGFQYPTEQSLLTAGDTLCLITDGVTEAQNTSHEFYGTRRLVACLERTQGTGDANSVVGTVERDVTRFSAGTEQADDLTVLVVQWLGPVSGR